MRTRNFAAIAAAALILGGSAIAQTRPTARPRANAPAGPRAEARPRAAAQNRMQQRDPLMRMLAQLDLTAAQQQRIQAITQEAQAKIQAIRQDASLTPEQKRQKSQPLMQAMRDQILGVLTPGQKRKLAEMRQRGPGGDRFMEMLQTLDLTDAQKAEIRKIMQAQAEKTRIIRESNLSDAEKRAKVQALSQETRRRVLAVLTPEQRQKLEGLRPGTGPNPPRR